MKKKEYGMENAGLRLEKLTVGYGGQPLISDISLEVKKGEILTLIGPNGAGKSTILKTLIGQLRAMGGKVFLMERDMSALSGREVATCLSMVMTERVKTEYMTCREVVSTGRYPYTGQLGILSEEDWAKVEECLELVHASGIAEQDFMEISDGQRQRVLLARALCQEPEVLVLDEPTSFLDVRYKLEMLSIIRSLTAEKQLAVIMSLHELDLARKISDRIACVKEGTIGRSGTPEEVFRGNYMSELYDMEWGSLDPFTDMPQMEKVKGKPQVFVIGGGGNAIDVYYHLQRQQIPFAAGIIMENDVEASVVSTLAAEVCLSPAFQTPEKYLMEQAKEWIARCESTICTVKSFGDYNEYNRELRDFAARLGKLKGEGLEWQK